MAGKEENSPNFFEDLGEIVSLWGQFVITFSVIESSYWGKTVLSGKDKNQELSELVGKRQKIREYAKELTSITVETIQLHLRKK